MDRSSGSSARAPGRASPLADLGQDVRRGARRLVKRPAMTVVAVLTLALGIGANTAVFSLVRGVLQRPLPYASPDRLTMVWSTGKGVDDDTWLSAREVLEYGREAHSFSSLAGYTDDDAVLTGEPSPERVRAGQLTAGLFRTLGVAPLRGRTFAPGEYSSGDDKVAVIGYGLWQRRFGGAADVVGSTLRVNGVPRTIVGIMPPDFRLPLDYREARPTELWTPAALDESRDLPWGDRSYFIVARLAPGATEASVNADLERILRLWDERGYVDGSEPGLDRSAVPLSRLLLGGVRPALLLLFGAVGLVLLIACANVANLLLARSESRRQEVATQAALGATRSRILRQLLVETGLLTLAGAALGLLLAVVTLRAGIALVPVDVIRARGVSLDAATLAFTALLAIGTALIAGIAPALRLSGTRVGEALSRARGEAGHVRRTLRRALVISETAFSVILVIGGVLLARSFMQLRGVDLGYRTDHRLTVSLSLPRAEYPEPDRVGAFYRGLLDRVRQLPGVESASAVRVLPLSASIGDWSITVEGSTSTAQADWQIVEPGYVRTMGLSLVGGRTFAATDRVGAPPVALINQTMAERIWPGRDPIGRRFHLGTLDQPWIEVVGVLRDVRRNSVLDEPRTEMYLLHDQFPAEKGGGSAQHDMTLVVKTAGAPLDLLPRVRAQIAAMDASLPLANARTMDDVAAAALAEQHFLALLLGSFAALALLLAAVGMYGVVSFSVGQRAHEMGIRMALGAGRSAIRRLVMGEGFAMAAWGVALGLAGAAGLTRLLASQLYGVQPHDPATFLAVPAVLLAVAVAASWLPARRAASAEPAITLREP